MSSLGRRIPAVLHAGFRRVPLAAHRPVDAHGPRRCARVTSGPTSGGRRHVTVVRQRNHRRRLPPIPRLQGSLEVVSAKNFQSFKLYKFFNFSGITANSTIRGNGTNFQIVSKPESKKGGPVRTVSTRTFNRSRIESEQGAIKMDNRPNELAARFRH